MFKFLNALFSSPADPDVAQRQSLIQAAIERAIEGTDTRLRALAGYQKKLQAPIETAVDHVVALVETIPESVELSAASFGANPLVRPMFCSVEHLHEVLGQMKVLRDYRAVHRGEDIHALLVVRKEERSVLGMALEGDTLRRDVLQTAVNFTSHRCMGLAASEPDTRWNLKKRAFDYLVGKALARLVEVKRGKGELERQRLLLQRKLDAMRAGEWGLETFMANYGPCTCDVDSLEAEIDAIEAELGECRGENLGLEESLSHIRAVLGDPRPWLDLRPLTLSLDHRGIRAEEQDNESRRLEFTELCSQDGERLIILLVRIPAGELPDSGDFLSKASYYLS